MPLYTHSNFGRFSIIRFSKKRCTIFFVSRSFQLYKVPRSIQEKHVFRVTSTSTARILVLEIAEQVIRKIRHSTCPNREVEIFDGSASCDGPHGKRNIRGIRNRCLYVLLTFLRHVLRHFKTQNESLCVFVASGLLT